MSTVKATGHLVDPPTITFSSGGRGNTDRPEIHAIVRDTDGASNRTIAAWFDRDALLDAIAAVDPVGQATQRVSEPAASE